MVTGSYFLFKCPWQKFKVGNSVLIGPFYFFKIWLCEIWKSWFKQNQGIGGQHLFMHIQVRLGVHYTLLLHCRGCIMILTITELNFAKFYVNTYSTFQGTVRLFSVQISCPRLFKALFLNQRPRRKLTICGACSGCCLSHYSVD